MDIVDPVDFTRKGIDFLVHFVHKVHDIHRLRTRLRSCEKKDPPRGADCPVCVKGFFSMPAQTRQSAPRISSFIHNRSSLYYRLQVYYLLPKSRLSLVTQYGSNHPVS